MGNFFDDLGDVLGTSWSMPADLWAKNTSGKLGELTQKISDSMAGAEDTWSRQLSDPSWENIEDTFNPLVGAPDPSFVLLNEMMDFDPSDAIDELIAGDVPDEPESPDAPTLDTAADTPDVEDAYRPRGRTSNIYNTYSGLMSPELTASTSLLGS